jgi:hypothetical protein
MAMSRNGSWNCHWFHWLNAGHNWTISKTGGFVIVDSMTMAHLIGSEETQILVLMIGYSWDQHGSTLEVTQQPHVKLEKSRKGIPQPYVTYVKLRWQKLRFLVHLTIKPVAERLWNLLSRH